MARLARGPACRRQIEGLRSLCSHASQPFMTDGGGGRDRAEALLVLSLENPDSDMKGPHDKV